MQDIHAIGGGGRLFGGGGGGGDRRLRPHSQHQNHQALKCPRCDSLNTKFCYYNNYNLSQPRHFCKSCRRYWTKGGVLRNVPVGGGCRKAKRTKSKPANPDSSAPVSTAATTTTTSPHQQRDRKASSHSSSESSSLTAANSNAIVATASTNAGAVAAAAGAAATAEVSGHSSGSVSNLLNVNDTKFYGHANANCGFEPATLLHEQGSDCGIFSEIGSFTSLITSSNETMSFGFGNMLSQTQGLDQNPAQWQHHQQQKMVNINGGGDELKMQEITAGGFDQSVQLELSALQGRSGNGGFGSLDWQAGGDQGLFDLPNAVDQAYWSQSQWTDQDQPSLYLP